LIIDSSAWIDFFRSSDTPARAAVRRVVQSRNVQLMTTDVIRFEVLAGSAPATSRFKINAAFAACDDIRQVPRADVDDAVELFQICRQRGETVRSPNDCLIAAIAIRVNVPVLHNDRDFDAIARHSALVVARG
jgi:hypothetical protein